MALLSAFFEKLAYSNVYTKGNAWSLKDMMSNVLGNNGATVSTSNYPGVTFLTTIKSASNGYLFMFPSNGCDCATTTKVTATEENGVVTLTAVYTITNNGEVDITLTDCYLRDYAYDFSAGGMAYVSLERTTLDNPVTIPANGGIGQITYEIKYTYANVTS